MSHVDEGLIHAWLEDQLPPDEAARVERLVATDSAWRAAAAEARGLIAATSRVIGALDSAPSSAGVSKTGRARTRQDATVRTRATWARRPWIRVAAAVVLVAGVSGLWLNRDIPHPNNDESLKDAIRKETKSATVAESPAVSGQTVPTISPRAPQAAQVSPRRDVPPPPERGRVGNVAPAPVAAAPPPAASTRPPAAVAANEVAAAKSVAAASDAMADSRVAGRGTGAGGGRGGRAAAQASALVEQGVVGTQVAKTLAVPDSIFRGCWIPVDTLRRERRQANENDAVESMILRFTPPVVTDLAGVRAPVSSSPPQAGTVSALRSAPPRARVQNATPRMKDDSTVVAEWLNRDGRTTTQLIFRLYGDTLRGATNAISGDLVIAGPTLVAVRALCSQ